MEDTNGITFVYVTESGCRYEGGGIEDVYATLEGARASKPTKFRFEYTNVIEDGTVIEERWLDSNFSDYFTITKLEVSDTIKKEFELKTCSHGGCSFREEYYYYSYELDKEFRDICHECGKEATEKEVIMKKALE